MTTPEESFVKLPGHAMSYHWQVVAQRVPDLSVLTTPSGLLRAMLYEVSTEAGWSRAAGRQALVAAEAGADQLFWREVQIMLTFAGTASRFVWPTTGSQKEPPLYPNRGSDIRLLLDIDTDLFQTLRYRRNDVIHMERLETAWHDGIAMGTRSMNGKRPDGGDFLSWTPAEKTLTFLHHDVSIPALIGDLQHLEMRSSEAFNFMLSVEDGDPIDVVGEWAN